jgi:hypothetical protein
MKNTASFEPKMLHPEQVSEQNADEKPWLRQRNEPAIWFMRFKRYLDLGPKRSLRKAVVDEPDTQKVVKGVKKQAEAKKSLSDVSVPGAWSRASKTWRWVERAEAYDLDQIVKQASQIRSMVSSAPYTSKAYRIINLDYVARLLRDQLKLKAKMALVDYLAITARYQSVMQQIAKEMQGLDEATLQVCDASAMLTIRQELLEEEYAKKMQGADDVDKFIAQLDSEIERRKIEKRRP